MVLLFTGGSSISEEAFCNSFIVEKMIYLRGKSKIFFVANPQWFLL